MSDDNQKRHHNWMADGANVIMLSAAFLIAIFIWFSYSLSKDYSAFLNFDVEIETAIDNRACAARSDGQLVVHAKADGFYLFRHQIFKMSAPVKLTVDKKFFIQSPQDTNCFILALSDIRNIVLSALSKDMTLDYFVTDSLRFFLPYQTSKKVPVLPNYSISCRPQYMQTQEILLSPDSVVIFGDQSLLRSIEAVRTENLSYRNVRSTIQSMVDIKPIEGITFSNPSVLFTVEIERFVEESVEVPVRVRSLPIDKRLVVIPSSITLTYRRKYPYLNLLHEDDFECIVDYEDYVNSVRPTLIPKIEDLPSDIFSYDFSPRVVECMLIETLE